MQKNEISPSVYRNIIVSKDNVQVRTDSPYAIYVDRRRDWLSVVV